MTKKPIYKNILRKLANSPDQEFEQSFFQLAYERLQEKLHNLLPFLVGFEIVNKNDEGTKALGVFGFKSNNGQMMFVPAFFINGTVKGIDLLYSKNNEQFYPLNEDFAELFLKDEVTGIGDKSKEHRNEINQRLTPVKLDSLSRPPKTAAFKDMLTDNEKQELLSSFLKTAKSIEYTDLISFVNKGPAVIKTAFYNLFKDNDEFSESVLRFYDLNKIASAITVPKVIKPKLISKVEVLHQGNEKCASLSDSDKLQLLTDGYYILDKRAEEEKSKLGLFKYTETFSNPTQSGFYSYITQRGTLRYGLALVSPMPLNPHISTGETIVIDLDSNKDGQAYRVEPNELFVKGRYQVKDFSEIHDKFEELNSASPSFSSSYVLINEELKCTEPFSIVANYKNDEGFRVIEVEQTRFIKPAKDRQVNSYFKDKPTNTSFRKFKLIMTKKQGDRLDYKGNSIFVPKGFKLFEVRFGDNYCCSDGPYDPEASKKAREEYKANSPGSLSDLNAALREDGVFPFSLNSNGSEYFVTVGDKKKKYSNTIEAKIGMVLDFGLSHDNATQLLNDLVPTITKQGQIKLAYTGDQILSLRDAQSYANILGQPTYDDYSYMEEGMRDPSYTGNPTELGRGTMSNVEGLNASINTANQLAESGQKQIFDTQTIATLSKYVSPQTKTMTYMPEFISCLDKLGRMLFLTYWETEKFEEMYGRSELPDLVELLSNVNRNLGDLVIYLKRKSPELSINMSEGDSSI